MKYILDKRYRFRGWYGAPCGIYDTCTHEARFLPPELYKVFLQFDADHEIDPEKLESKARQAVGQAEKEGVIRKAGMFDFLLKEQCYKAYPARYRESVHWSVTGACNLKCRHCFMSAPHAKHGAPDHEEIMQVIGQLAECGIFNVQMTGGEPLIRDDFLEIVDELCKREIALTTIYTNGWLVDSALLHELESRGLHPSFQLSFDGIGKHDFLRGIPGAEERTIRALELLKERDYLVEVSFCLHRDNADTLRESIKLLASLGVSGVKVGTMMNLGEWADPAVADLKLSLAETLEFYEQYIPQYFEDDAPLDLMLGGAFLFEKETGECGSFYHRECPAGKEDDWLACGSLGKSFYLGADGVVAPCQGMCDCGLAKTFPSLKKMPLAEILKDSEYVKLSYGTVGDVRRGNEDCRKCAYTDRCTGGCRNTALICGNHYYDVDREACFFFKNGWEERIRAAAEPALEEYKKRNASV